MCFKGFNCPLGDLGNFRVPDPFGVNPYGFVYLSVEIPPDCLVDAFDAMTSDRPYRKAMTSEAAFAELRRCSGAQFDPCLVEDFMAVARECL